MKRKENKENVLSKNVKVSSSSPIRKEEEDFINDLLNVDVKETKEKKTLEIGFIIKSIVISITSFFILGCFVYLLYDSYIRYPEMKDYSYEYYGMYELEKWEDLLEGLDQEKMTAFLGTKSYLADELILSNSNEKKIAFYKTVLSTIEYTISQEDALNIYGNTYIDRNTLTTEKRDSLVEVGTEIDFSYIDYDSIEIDKSYVKDKISKIEGGLGNPKYNTILTDIFCDYILYLNEKDILPVKKEKRIPNLEVVEIVVEEQAVSKIKVSPEEDIFLDDLLFSSIELRNLFVRFSTVACVGEKNPLWDSWNNLSKKERKGLSKPEKVMKDLPLSEEYLKRVASGELSESGKSTITIDMTDFNLNDSYLYTYDFRWIIPSNWCGSYWLSRTGGFFIDNGDGSFERPSDIGTSVITYIKTKIEGKFVEKPIKITLTAFGVDKEAVDFFESKDIRNRGIDLKSEVRYAYFKLSVVNMSDVTLTIKDTSSLCDENINYSNRTGYMYGLVDKLKLKPNEQGVLESWVLSTELEDKYLIWGRDSKRNSDVVWFRVLAGDYLRQS